MSMAGGTSAQAESLRVKYSEKLELLAKGKMTLVDATETTHTPVHVGEQEATGTFNEDENGDERDPVFTRTMEF